VGMVGSEARRDEWKVEIQRGQWDLRPVDLHRACHVAGRRASRLAWTVSGSSPFTRILCAASASRRVGQQICATRLRQNALRPFECWLGWRENAQAELREEPPGRQDVEV
jgi:hypothetical protein